MSDNAIFINDTVEIPIDTKSIDGYNLFLKCKKLPVYKVIKNSVVTDIKSYNYLFNDTDFSAINNFSCGFEFDYQQYVLKTALKRERYAAFLDCGLGKTIIELLFLKSISDYFNKKTILFCPLNVIEDIQKEAERVLGYRLSNLRNEKHITDIAIINYESLKEIDMSNVIGAVIDESSILKSGDGEICNYLIKMFCNLKFRLACSATPSPNSQTEYAPHSVLLGYCSTQKEFYSKFFVKDGTEWRMKGHASEAFYDFLKSWCCYIHSPSKLGFQKGAELDYEPNYIVLKSFTKNSYLKEGMFLSDSIDLKMSQKIFSKLRSDINEDRFNQSLESINGKRCIIWCTRNSEEEAFKKHTKGVLINGSTPLEKRIEIVKDFKLGNIETIISKPSVLGFGVNIQEADCHLYSGYTFSFEQFYQSVRRSHRYGRKGVLDVYVPVSEPETPVWDLISKKLNTFKKDVLELQSRFFN